MGDASELADASTDAATPPDRSDASTTAADAATDPDGGDAVWGGCRPGYYEGTWVGSWHAILMELGGVAIDYSFGPPPASPPPSAGEDVTLYFVAEANADGTTLRVRNGCINARTYEDISTLGSINDLISGNLVGLVDADWDCASGTLSGTVRGHNGHQTKVSGTLSGVFDVTHGGFNDGTWSALAAPQDPPDPSHGGMGSWQATRQGSEVPSPSMWPQKCLDELARFTDAH